MALARVMLADDHTMLVEAFRKLLESQCEVVGTASDGRSLLETAPRLKPDVIIVDIAMPLMNGLEAGLRLKELMPTTKLIFLTMNEDADLAVEAMQRGACDFIEKPWENTRLLAKLRKPLEQRKRQRARGLEITRELELAVEMIEDVRRLCGGRTAAERKQPDVAGIGWLVEREHVTICDTLDAP